MTRKPTLPDKLWIIRYAYQLGETIVRNCEVHDCKSDAANRKAALDNDADCRDVEMRPYAKLSGKA